MKAKLVISITFFTLILLASKTSFSQKVTAILKDGSTQQVEIIESGDNFFYIKGKRLFFRDIQSVNYFKDKKLYFGDQTKLARYGVTVLINGVEKIIAVEGGIINEQHTPISVKTDTVTQKALVGTSPVINNPATSESEYVRSTELNMAFNNFRQSSAPPKIIQLLGAGTLALGFILAKKQSDDAAAALKQGRPFKTSDTPIKLEIAGSVALFFGLVIDLGSVGNLNLRRKP